MNSKKRNGKLKKRWINSDTHVRNGCSNPTEISQINWVYLCFMRVRRGGVSPSECPMERRIYGTRGPRPYDLHRRLRLNRHIFVCFMRVRRVGVSPTDYPMERRSYFGNNFDTLREMTGYYPTNLHIVRTRRPMGTGLQIPLPVPIPTLGGRLLARGFSLLSGLYQCLAAVVVHVNPHQLVRGFYGCVTDDFLEKKYPIGAEFVINFPPSCSYNWLNYRLNCS